MRRAMARGATRLAAATAERCRNMARAIGVERRVEEAVGGCRGALTSCSDDPKEAVSWHLSLSPEVSPGGRQQQCVEASLIVLL